MAVVVPATTPEQTARLWDQIRQILEQNLGSPRAKLLMEMGGDRLDEACGQPVQSEIRVIVMRHPDGKYMYDNSVGRFGEGVDASDVLRHMPPYLRSFFTDILNPSAAGNPVANPQAE